MESHFRAELLESVSIRMIKHAKRNKHENRMKNMGKNIVYCSFFAVCFHKKLDYLSTRRERNIYS